MCRQDVRRRVSTPLATPARERLLPDFWLLFISGQDRRPLEHTRDFRYSYPRLFHGSRWLFFFSLSSCGILILLSSLVRKRRALEVYGLRREKERGDFFGEVGLPATLLRRRVEASHERWRSFGRYEK